MSAILPLLCNKRGNVFIISYIGIIMAIFLTALIVDYGSAFTYKVQLQHITDAAVLGAAHRSKRQMNHPRLGMRAFFMDDEARDEAHRLIGINRNFLSSRVQTGEFRLNPSGEFGRSTENQFYGGFLTIRWSGNITPHLLAFFGDTTSRIQFSSHASAQTRIRQERIQRDPEFWSRPAPLYRGIIFSD